MLARIIPNGSLEQIIYRVDALHWIEERGVPVMNSPRAIERSVDKFYTTALLQEAGLPTPETVVCERAADAMAAIRAMLGTDQPWPDGGRAVIIKPIFGSMGHGMVRVSDPDVAFRVVRSLEQIRAVFYVQRAIDHGGRDVRVFVVGGSVIGAIERRAPDGEWRTNVSRGGSARRVRRCRPSGSELALARRGGGRRRLRRRRSAAVARWSGVRAGGERHSGLAGAAAGHRDRRRRRDRGSPRAPRATVSGQEIRSQSLERDERRGKA